MSQFLTLIWLKWKLFRNSLRSSKAVANQISTVIGMVIAFVLALIVAIGLGFAGYALNRPHLSDAFRQAAASEFPGAASSEFIFFSILAFIYLMWATVPLSIGTAKQFDVAKMLMYPISLRKLFAFDFLSEISTLQSVFAIPAITTLAIGAGLGSGNVVLSLIAAPPAILFGVALSKWLSTIVGALLRRKRSRGETLLALIGAIAGLGGAFAGQAAPILLRHAESVRGLRWTPPGAAAVLIMGRGDDLASYAVAFVTLSLYAIVLVFGTFWIARRAALGLGGKRKREVIVNPSTNDSTYSGWKLPLASTQLSAIIEKEFRYALRNAQLKTLALMPLVLLIIRFFNSKRLHGEFRNSPRAAESFFAHASGLITTGGVLYVFLILAGLSFNLFAFEESGMRTLILSPIDRKNILIGKNIVVVVLAFVFSTILVSLNAIVFRDATARDLLFAGLNFVIFAAIMSVIGNWLSLSFPKRMKFGKRMNVSGVAGLLMIPLIGLLAIPAFLSAFVGYMTSNRLFEYATLAAFAVLSIGLYVLLIGVQGRSLARREINILEVVKEPADE
jgi:hypothetical protein